MYGKLISWVEEDCNIGHAVPDHSSACLHADLHQLRQPGNAAILEEMLQHAPLPAWEVDANEHAHQLVTWIHQELARAFPKSTASKKKPNFASEDTATAHAYVVSAKRQCRIMMRMLRDLLLRRAFQAWMGTPLACNYRHWLHVIRLRFYRTKCEMGQLAHQLRLQLRQDKKTFIQEIAENASQAAPSEIFKKLRPILQPAKRQATVQRSLPRLLKSDGSYTSSPEEINAEWVSYFASLEAGEAYEPAEFMRKALKEQTQNILPSDWLAKELPQLSWLEHAVRKMRNSKAPGPDLIPNDLLLASPAATARMMLPLLWKMFLRLQEPVIWKGGRLIPISKQKGPQDRCTSYRGILLMSSLGKLLRSAGRDFIAAPFFHQGEAMQLGGKPGMPVQFGNQAVRAFQGYAKKHCMSSSIIFADVQSAYYKVLRELATGNGKELTVDHIIRKFNLDESAPRALHEALHQQGSQEQLGGSALQVALMTEGLSGTWFSCSRKEIEGHKARGLLGGCHFLSDHDQCSNADQAPSSRSWYTGNVSSI